MIDHLIYAAPELEAAVAYFERAYGITATPGGSHTGLGTRNALVGLGHATYLEIVGIDHQQVVPPGSRFFGLEAGFEPRFASWCARAKRPLEATVAIALEAGLDLGDIAPMSRVRPDGSTLSWTLTSPFAQREGGVLPFYIDWGDAPSPGSTLPPVLELVSLTVAHPDPARIRAILDALGEVDVRVEHGEKPALTAVLQP